MSIVVNTVLQFNDDKDTKIRVVWLDNNNAYYVKLSDIKSLPKKMAINKIEESIKNDEYFIVPDPYAKSIDENSLTDKSRYDRDTKYEIIRELWEGEEKQLFDNKKRMTRFNKIAEKYNMSVHTLRRLLTRYLVRGLNKNALLSDYNNSGGKGKERKATTEKRGRPVEIKQDIKGINIDDTIKALIKKVYQSQYLSKQKKSYKDCYYHLLKEYFSDKIVVEDEVSYQVWNQDRIPTYNQFVYWCKKFKDVKNQFVKREGENKFLGTKREIQSSSNEKIVGPGYTYQIDATVADVYLLSESIEGNIIGRPIVYAVIDVFSRMVVGIYVGLEGPSWIGAMMALDNVVQDKVEFCTDYGVSITSEEWPLSYLPMKIVADRGEFEGYNVHNLINNLHVQILNTPPYRGDLKGIVERKFRTVNSKIKETTPGAVIKQYRERGDKPYYLDAKLTLHDFTKELIYLVLDHNKDIIDNYQRDRQMLRDNVLARPIELWQWGMENRRTALVSRERDIVRLNLLPRGTATITRRGLRFSTKIYYSCSKAIEEQWFIKLINNKVEFVYDPRNMNCIYIINEDGSDYMTCQLTEACNIFRDLSLYEIKYMMKLDRQQTAAYKHEQTKQKVDLNHKINTLVSEAKKRAIETNESDRSRQLAIRDNRLGEKKLNRQKEYFELDNNDIHTDSQVISLKGLNFDQQDF